MGLKCTYFYISMKAIVKNTLKGFFILLLFIFCLLSFYVLISFFFWRCCENDLGTMMSSGFHQPPTDCNLSFFISHSTVKRERERGRERARERERIKWAHQCFCLTWTNLCVLLSQFNSDPQKMWCDFHTERS